MSCGHKTKPSSMKSLNISSINLYAVNVKCKGNNRGNRVSSKQPTLSKLEQIAYPLQSQLAVKTYKYQIESCYSTIKMKMFLQ